MTTSEKYIKPLNWLDKLSQALLREPQDREQLVSLLRDAEQRNLLDADALSMIEGVLQFSELQVRDIMIPRNQMVSICADENLQTFLPSVINSGHSRFPVLNETKDEVIGILHAKDLLKFKIDEKVNLRDLIRPAMVIPDSKRIDTLLKEFRTKRNHMAIVVDEYGAISGFVTIEDIIEQIVGDIEDEFDIDEDAFIKQISDEQYIIKAHIPVNEFNKYFSTQLPANDFDTIAGLIIKSFEHLPKRGEKITLPPFEFEVLLADNRRVRLLKAVRIITVND